MILTRVLDKYFCMKLTSRIKYSLCNYLLDFKIYFSKHQMILYAKPTKYKNYSCIFTLNRNEAFDVLLEYPKYSAQIVTEVQKYFEENLWT